MLDRLPPELWQTIFEHVSIDDPIWRRPSRRFSLRLICTAWSKLVQAVDDAYLVISSQHGLVAFLTRLAMHPEVAETMQRLCVRVPTPEAANGEAGGQGQFSLTILSGILNQCQGLTHLLFVPPRQNASVTNYMDPVWSAIVVLKGLRAFAYVSTESTASSLALYPSIPQSIVVRLAALPDMHRLAIHGPIGPVPPLHYPSLSPAVQHLRLPAREWSIEHGVDASSRFLTPLGRWFFTPDTTAYWTLGKLDAVDLAAIGPYVNLAALEIVHLANGSDHPDTPLPSLRRLVIDQPLAKTDGTFVFPTLDPASYWSCLRRYPTLDTIELTHVDCAWRDPHDKDNIIVDEDDQPIFGETSIWQPAPSMLEATDPVQGKTGMRMVVLRCRWSCEMDRLPEDDVARFAERGIAYVRRRGLDLGWVTM